MLASTDELESFRRFQRQPFQRDRPVADQLRRFLGTQSTRKIRYGAELANVLDLDRLPPPLASLVALL